jgi:tetratricopeptide (TPR) repeat protein
MGLGIVRRTLAIAVVALVVVTGVLAWRARRLPVAETREFLNAPMAVGQAPAAPPASPSRAPARGERLAAARDAFSEGRYREAADGFAAVVAEDPTGPDAAPAQWNLVRSRLRTGDGAGAITGVQELLARHAGWLGTQAPALRDGAERMERGDLAGARAAFERMLVEQPDSELVPLAHALLARVHWAHGDAMGMVRSFARMLGSVPDAVPAYARLAHYLGRYAEGDAGVADAFAELAETGDEGFRDIYQYMAARTLLEQGRFEATASALETLRRRHPDGDFTHIVDLEHAWNFLRQGRAEEALAIFRRLEATPPPARTGGLDAFFDLPAELPMGTARSLAALGRYEEAAAAFERAIAADPQGMYEVENRIGLAAAYEGLGQRERAAATLAAVIAKHPDEPKIRAVRQQLARVQAAARP